MAKKDNLTTPIFPFTAIIGQDQMKTALQLNVIDPKIGGVLIMGDRGTGKSTVIRALADLLPEIEVVVDDKFNSHPTDTGLMSDDVKTKIESNEEIKTKSIKIPMVDLPLGATEDRVCGTIDIEKALKDGSKQLEPGLLAEANRGFLYVDEINLLDDHLVDILLDSAASGWNTVEREGISVRHPARFVLVGSGNPEEGELRPQLTDRFGMRAQASTEQNPEIRAKIVEERMEFDRSPIEFIQKHNEKQQQLRDRILNAKELLSDVKISKDIRTKLSDVCSSCNVDGLRGDMAATRAAVAYAALHNRSEVTYDDVEATISICLQHRLRRDVTDVDYYNAESERVEHNFKRIFLGWAIDPYGRAIEPSNDEK